MKWRTDVAWFTAALISIVVLTGCGGSHGDTSAGRAAKGQYGGELEGTDAQVGVSAGKERVTVYVCDNGTISEWFVTDHPSNELRLASPGGAVATVSFVDHAVTGTVTLRDGTRHNFRATPQAHPVIHRAEAAADHGTALAGWVTVGDRTTGSLSITSPGTGTLSPAPTLTPDTNIPLSTGSLSTLTAIVTVSGDSTFTTPNRPMTFVIGGAGDSYASGEGNPVDPPSSSTGKPTNLASMWGPEFGMNGCHRSDDAAIPRAFRALKTKYPGFDIRLAFAGCGGARITHVTGWKDGGGPGDSGAAYGPELRGDDTGERTDRWDAISEPAQLKQIDDRVRTFGSSLPVDLLVMSIGGNDAGFAPSVGHCVTGGTPTNVDGLDPNATVLGLKDPTPCNSNPALSTALSDNGPPADSALAKEGIPGWNEVLRRYNALDDTIEAFSARQRPIGQVLLQHYAAGLKNTDGSAYCGGRSANTRNDLFGFISPTEAAFLDTRLIGGLNTTVDKAVTAANVGAAGPRWKASGASMSTFRNHGPCAADPWTHINATALSKEGNNLPDFPDDPNRRSLAALNTALATATGAAVGCGIGAMTIVFTLPACAAGAQFGFIVGLATNEQESAVSAGMAHPNKEGWHQVGDALFPDFDAAFQKTFTPLGPNRTRQFGAAENGDIIVRWDDRSSTETRYEVEIYDDASPANLVTRQTNLSANATSFTYKPNKAFVGRARVRACNAALCSPFGASVKITNIKTGTPTNVSALIYQNQTLAADLPTTLVVDATDPKNADTATRIELTQLTDAAGNSVTASPKIFDVPAPFPSVFAFGGTDGIPAGRYRVRAASCNVLGCSNFATPSESSPAPAAPPKLDLAELPPFVVDKLGLTRPRFGPAIVDPLVGVSPSTIPLPGP
jgi:hypothetical protein